MGKDSFSAVITGILFLAVCAYGAVFVRERLGGGITTVPLTASCVTVGSEIRGIAVRHESLQEKNMREYENGVRLPAGNTASRSVLYISRCDGFEYLTPELFYDMSADGLESLLASDGEKKGRFGKLVSGFEWYIAAVSENGEIPEKGSCMTVELPDGTEHRAECVYSPAQGCGEVFLLRLTDGDAECSLRKIDALLIEKRIEGCEIPAEALHSDECGREYVYAVRSGRAQAVFVQTELINGGTCIISAPELREGEEIITAGKNIYDGMVIS